MIRKHNGLVFAFIVLFLCVMVDVCLSAPKVIERSANQKFEIEFNVTDDVGDTIKFELSGLDYVIVANTEKPDIFTEVEVDNDGQPYKKKMVKKFYTIKAKSKKAGNYLVTLTAIDRMGAIGIKEYKVKLRENSAPVIGSVTD